jgi:hypothetical protein
MIKSPLPILEEKGNFLKQLRGQAQEAINHAQKMMLIYHERKKRGRPFRPFALGEKVWLEGTNLRLSPHCQTGSEMLQPL